LKWTQYTRFGIEEDAMPEAPSDIDYTVDIGRHETIFRANTPKGEELLGGVDLTMSNEDAHTFIQDARAAGLTVNRFSNTFENRSCTSLLVKGGKSSDARGARLQQHSGSASGR
jgi:hypothetical protein